MSEAAEATDPHRMAQRITEAACKCGHRWRNHDPEDGDCESLDTRTLDKCACRSYRSPSPDHTTAEWLVVALLVGEPAEPVSPKEGERSEATNALRDPAVWQAVADALGEHSYIYDLSDSSHRLDVVQIVCVAAASVLAKASDESPTRSSACAKYYAHSLDGRTLPSGRQTRGGERTPPPL